MFLDAVGVLYYRVFMNHY